jgi:hypothetical protein
MVVFGAMGTLAANAGPMSRSSGSSPWMAYWPAKAVASYEASWSANDAAINAVTPSNPTTGSLVALPAASPAPAQLAPAPVVIAPSPPTPTFTASSAAIAVTPAQTIAASASSSPPVDAFLNFTSGPYPESATLAAGTPQPWYQSPSVVQAFGAVPTAQQQANFTQTVLQDVQHTYQLSGMNPTLTTDPNMPALHTLSVVSGASYADNPSAIGITNVGTNGFSFIDKLNYANNPTDLAWAVAHNIAHELMHAFGLGYHPDAAPYVDAGSASWQSLTDPNAQFGPAATALLLASQYGRLTSNSTNGSGLGAELLNPDGTKIDGDEVVAQAVPEPTTVVIWGGMALGALAALRRRSYPAVA